MIFQKIEEKSNESVSMSLSNENENVVDFKKGKVTLESPKTSFKIRNNYSSKNVA